MSADKESASPAGQTYNGQFFSKIWTESRQIESGQKIQTQSGQQTDAGHDSPENTDKNETRTGQCYPSTSAYKRILF